MRGWAKALFWLSLLLGGSVYALMVLWTLPAITSAAGGLTPFDLRPGGYSPEEAQAFVSALSPEGLALYLGWQHRLDVFYPLLLGIALFSGLVLLAPENPKWVKWVIACLAIPGTVFDWCENALVTDLLMSKGPLDEEVVMVASYATVLKSVFTTVAAVVLLAELFVWAWQRKLARRG